MCNSVAGDSLRHPLSVLELSGFHGIVALDMDYEDLLRSLYYLAKIIAISPETCEALSKWWKSFKEFLPSLDYPEVREEAPSPIVLNTAIVPGNGTLQVTDDAPPTLYLNVFETVHLGGSASTSATLA
jgi:hypothetical protein